MPCAGVSLLTFGGRNMDTLYVTTQRAPFELSSGKMLLDNSPESGKIFKIEGLKAKGYPPRNYCVSKP